MTLYRLDADKVMTGWMIRAVDDAIQAGVLVPVEPDGEAKDALDLIDAYLTIVRNILGVGEETP